MDAKKQSRFSPPAVGGTSLLVVFAVLCLTVFALLSLATVQADRRLADSAVQGVADYYAADCKAQETLARLRNGEFPAGVTRHSYEPQAGGVRCSYAVPISEGQERERGSLEWRRIRTCIHSRGCRLAEGFFRQARRIFAGILCVLQENSTQYGGKRPGQTAFEVVNTGSKGERVWISWNT